MLQLPLILSTIDQQLQQEDNRSSEPQQGTISGLCQLLDSSVVQRTHGCNGVHLDVEMQEKEGMKHQGSVLGLQPVKWNRTVGLLENQQLLPLAAMLTVRNCENACKFADE